VEERLQKIMARANLGSRRASEAIIEAGRVVVNGRIAKLGDKADPAVDRIEVDGRPLALSAGPASGDKLIYIALNKPRGVISSLEDEMEEGRTTVRDLIQIDAAQHIYPVGRLDKPSEGLVLMTNDGALAHRLTHPRYGHEKVYDVVVEGWMADRQLDQWRRGVMLDGRITAPAPIEVIQRDQESTHLRIVLREGRKRQIRRVAAALGHPVRRLIRERIGPLSLGDLAPGQWRYLTGEEIHQLKSNADGHAAPREQVRSGRGVRQLAYSNKESKRRGA
jgi:pseudouridine synthase